MKDLKEKTIRGGFARLLAQAANFALRIGSLMILARLLGPRDFGLVGMVTAFTGVLSLFRDFGLSTATVQRATVTSEQISTLFWVNLGVGAALSVATAALAPAIVSFYHEPKLLWVTVLIASSFLINAVGVQHSAMLQRNMRFTTLSVINVIATLVSTVVAIALAKAGFGYWALAAMVVAGPITSTACVLLAGPWLPGLPQSNIGLRSIVHFGGTITLNGVVVYIAYNLEKVLLGRFWGADAIGLYGRAYQLVNVPTDNLNSAVGEVAFAALSRLQNEPQRLRSYFLKGYSLVLAMTVPITLISTIYAKDMIFVLLGAKWHEAVPIFRFLAPTILIFAMINPFSWLLFAIGEVNRSLKIAFVIAPLVMAGYLIGLPYGPKGVALGYSASMALWLLPHFAWCVHGTSISFWDVLRALSAPLASGVAASLCAFLSWHLCGQLPTALLRVAAGATLFVIVFYGVLLFVMGQWRIYADLIRGLISRKAELDKSLSTT
jgi:PST family polysaccharide transporter